MADFKLNAQVNLVSPSAANLKTVSESIRKGLGKSANIKLKISGKGLKELNTNLANLNKSITSTQAKITKLGSSYTKVATQSQSLAKAQQQVAASAKNSAKGIQSASNSLQGFGKNIVKTIKNAAAFSLVAGPIFGVQRALTNAAKEAALFQKEITKISQVTGQSAAELGSLANTIDRLSVSLGLNAKELAQTARVIAQTGRSGKELELILRGLAQSTLAASFGDISSTTEGLIAILGQFNLSGKDTEAILGSINQVSKQFAVESDDLVQAVRRTGAVFNASAGGTKNSIEALQAFNAIFTSVRANTRESSETIAAGLKTIFARLQRRDTIDFLRDFGIELVATADDAKLLGVAVGDFVGQEEAFRRLSKGLADTNNAITRSAIVEEIGGIRQIGKLIPAIENFADAEAAIAAGAKGAAKGLQEDVDKALQTVAQRVEVVQATFNKFVKDIFESDAFQKFAKNVISSTEQLIKTFSTLFDALEPILPLLSALGTFKIAGSVLALGKSAAPVAAGAASAAAGAVSAAKTGAAGATTTADTQILRSIDTNILAIRNRLVGPGVGGVTGSTGAAGGASAPGSAGFIGPIQQQQVTKTSQAVRGFGKAVLGAGKVTKDLATRGFPTFGNALKRSSTVVGNAFGKLSRSLKSTGASLGATGGVATQAALGLSIFAATTLDADSALGQLANQAIGVIFAISLLGPAVRSAVAQIVAAGAAAQAGTLTAAGALGPAALIAAAPIIGGIIGAIVADQLIDAIFPPLEELGSAAGIANRSIEEATRQGRQKRQITGASIGGLGGAGLGAALGALAGSLFFGVGSIPGGIIGGAIGGSVGGAGGLAVGSVGGGQREAEQQRLFDANKRLRDATLILNRSFEELKKSVDAANLKQFNDELSKFRAAQARRIREGIQFDDSRLNFVTVGRRDFVDQRRQGQNVFSESRETLARGGFIDETVQNRLLDSSRLLKIVEDSIKRGETFEQFDQTEFTRQVFSGKTAASDFQRDPLGIFDLSATNQAQISATLNSGLTRALSDIKATEITQEATDQIAEAIALGIENSFTNIDLSDIDLATAGLDEFNNAVRNAAEEGSEFAQQLRKVQAERSLTAFDKALEGVSIVLNEKTGDIQSVSVAPSLTGRSGERQFGAESGAALGGILTLIRGAIAEDPTLLAEGNEERLARTIALIESDALKGLAGTNRQGAADDVADIRGTVKNFVDELKENSKGLDEGAVNLALAAEAARRASDGLDSFVEALRDIVGAVERAANDVEVAGDNFRRTQQSLSGRGDLQSVRLNTGIGLRQGADLRSTQFANFQIGTGVDTQNIRNFNNAISSFSDIARSSAQSLRQEGGEVSSTTVVNRLVQDFESEIGQKLPAALNDSLRNAIIGVSRQNTEGGIVNLGSFEEAIRQGALENISDEVFQELNDTTEKLIEQFQKLSDNIIEAANAEAQLNKARRDAALEITQRRQRGQEDRDRLFGRQPQTFGQAEQNLEQQLGAILGEAQKNNDLTGQGLLQRRAELQEQLRSARESTQTQGAERPQEVIDNIAGLQTELQATTEALDLLSSETGRLNALRAEANKLLAQREQAQQITRGFLDEAVQNGFTVTAEDLEKKLDFIAAGTGGGSLRDATADTAAIANLSNEELVGSVEALNSGLSSQIARLQLGDEAFAKLQLELDKETARRIFESLPEDSRTAEAFDQIVKALEVERELENIEQKMLQVQEDQLTALQQLTGQDIVQAEIDLQAFRDAISQQAEVIKQEVENLNTLLKPLGEGPTGASGDPIFVAFAGGTKPAQSLLDSTVTGSSQQRVPLDTKSSEFSQAVADEVTRNVTDIGNAVRSGSTLPATSAVGQGARDRRFEEEGRAQPGIGPILQDNTGALEDNTGKIQEAINQTVQEQQQAETPASPESEADTFVADPSVVPPPPPRPPEADGPTPGTLGELLQDVKDTVNDIGEITPFPNGTQPVDPSLVPGSDGAAAGQIAPGEIQKAAQANTQSAVALNSAAQSLSTATTETSTALANATKDFKSAAQAWDGVSIPENVDVSISPVNVVGTDQFAQALEPTLTRIVENSVVKVLEMALQDQYNGPQVGPGFDPNMA